MSTVYDDAYYEGHADTKVSLTFKEKTILNYESDLLKRVLSTIANCSDNSTLDGVKGLAKMTLNDLA